MKELNNYSELYPNMPIEIILFFSNRKIVNGTMEFYTISQFCDFYKKKYNTSDYPQPRLVSMICDKLVEYGSMSITFRGGPDNANSSYICFPKVDLSNPIIQNFQNRFLSYQIYGFTYIYKDYYNYILPVEFTDNKGDISLGTAFLYKGGIVTAKHCIEGAKKISIKGIDKDLLSNSEFLIHPNSLMDLLYIKPKDLIAGAIFLSEDANILDEIMTLGYPKISGYHNFLAAENATVSARFTTTTGQLVSEAEDIWIRERLFLITAKIKGGNSGGPVINKKGAVVGISVSMPFSKGDYDEIGYGTAIPIKYLDIDILNNPEIRYLNVDNIEFYNFKE